MNREAIGHVAAAILRHINAMLRIDDRDREKTTVVAEDITAVDWASLTFEGQRHRLCLRIDGDIHSVDTALARISAEIADAELPLPGHFVAEIQAVAGAAAVPRDDGTVSRSLIIEALVLRD